MLTITSARLADHHISPFEGGWGDVYNHQIDKSTHRQIDKSPNRLII